MLAQLINSGRLKRGVDGSYSISDAPDSNTMYGGAEQGQLFGDGLVGQAISNPIVNGVKGVTTLPGERTDYTPEEVLEYKNFIGTHGGFERLPTALQGLIWNGATDKERSLAQYAWAKKAQDNPGIGNPLKGIASFLTAGVSDLFQGNTPGSGAIGMTADVFNAPSGVKNWLQNLGSSITTFGGSDLVEGFKKADKMEGSFWDKLGAGFDRSVDPGGTVDTHTRVTGDAIYNLWPEITPYLKSLGTTIGTAVGSIIPGIGNIAGAAIGTGIGSKLGSGTRNYDYFGDAVDTLLSTGSAYLGSQGVNSVIRGALTTGGKLLKNTINPRSKNPNSYAEAAHILASSLPGLSASGGGLLSSMAAGGLLSSPKQNIDPTAITQQALYPQISQQQGLVPIDWEAELKRLSMPLEIKRKKEEEDTYMNYKFKPKDYLVNYL